MKFRQPLQSREGRRRHVSNVYRFHTGIILLAFLRCKLSTELKARKDALTAFLGIAAHDLKAPE